MSLRLHDGSVAADAGVVVRGRAHRMNDLDGALRYRVSGEYVIRPMSGEVYEETQVVHSVHALVRHVSVIRKTDKAALLMRSGTQPTDAKWVPLSLVCVDAVSSDRADTHDVELRSLAWGPLYLEAHPLLAFAKFVLFIQNYCGFECESLQHVRSVLDYYDPMYPKRGQHCRITQVSRVLREHDKPLRLDWIERQQRTEDARMLGLLYDDEDEGSADLEFALSDTWGDGG